MVMVDFAGTTDARLDEMVGAIVDQIRPELILLFGSRARGDAREDSDYDLMIVVRDQAAVESSRRTAYAALRESKLTAEILARSVEDYKRRQHDPGFMDFMVSREGRLLYTTGAVPQRSPAPGRVREAEDHGEGLAMWIERAGADLRLAEESAAGADPVWDGICFHSHACVEKLLKALTVRRGTFPPKTHELKTLLAMQPNEIRENVALIAACKLLGDLYPKSRYPESPFPTPEEAKLAMETARTARDILLPLMLAAR